MKKFLDMFRRQERHRDRSRRIRLLLSDGARLETADETFLVLNLSETGLGILAEKASPPDQLEGTLVLGTEALTVALDVVRRSGSHVGAKFRGDSSPVRAALRRQFTDEIRATEMSEVDSTRLSQDAPGSPRWFYAPENYELYFLEREGKVTRIEIEWNGRVVTAQPGEILRSGLIESEDRQKPGHAKSSLVKWEAEVADRHRAKAIRILENIPGLDPLVRGKLVRLVRNAD